MTYFRQGNDRRRPRGSGKPEAGVDVLWGWHAVTAALANPARGEPKKLYATKPRAQELTDRFGAIKALEVVDPGRIAQFAPPGAVHQNLILKAAPIEPADLETLATPAQGVILILDQVTDPQNVGAIFRSAAAFGARGLILQERHAPQLAGALAKAAAGAVDQLPHARVVNLSRALETLTDLGWRTIGLDGEATLTLAEAVDGGPTVLVMGSEGEGIRRLVAEHCDVLAKIPMPGRFESLNVSAAAAVALYEAARGR